MAGSFHYQHRVTYSECAIGDHVYYARYLDLLEAARGELFRQAGVTFHEWQLRDCAFPVIECRLRYKSPARYDDVLDIQLWVPRAEGARLDFAARILSQTGTLVLEGETAHVCTTLAGKPRRLPPELIESLRRWPAPED